jgi:hypothetical protein
MNTRDPLTSPNALELIRRLWVDRSLWLCLEVEAIALVLNAMFRMLGCLVWWWSGGIYSPQPSNGRWGMLLSMGAPDSLVRHRTGTVGCPVRRHVTQPLGFGSSWPLEALCSCGTGRAVDRWRRCLLVAPDSPVPYRICHVHCPVQLWLLLWLMLCTVAFAESTVARVSRCSIGAPDCPVNYSGVRLVKPESGWFIFVWTWCTGHCPVRQSTAHSSFFAPLNLIPNLNIYWFVLNLFAPVEHVL